MEKAHQIKVKADEEVTIAKVIIPCFCEKTHLILRQNLSIRGEAEVAQKMSTPPTTFLTYFSVSLAPHCTRNLVAITSSLRE